MGRDPKQFIITLAAFYALFQLTTQVSNPAAGRNQFLVATTLSPIHIRHGGPKDDQEPDAEGQEEGAEEGASRGEATI